MNVSPLSSDIETILLSFRGCFTAPSFKNFQTLVVGWMLCVGRHSISRVLQAGRWVGGTRHHSVLYRFLSRGRWSTDKVSEVLLSLFEPLLPEEITVLVDDTLCHKNGPRLFGAGMHHDASRSTYGRGTSAARQVAFSFGLNWVVLALWLPLPWGKNKGMAIPFLFRLYRSKKLCPESLYRKRTELARELVTLCAEWLPTGRMLHVVGDSEYACVTLVRSLPENVLFTGPVHMQAALYALPSSVARRGRGRPRVKGRRLPSPTKLAADKTVPWRTVTLTIYGRTVKIKTKTMVCLWYTVAGTRLIRVVVTRDPKGRLGDRAYFCTDGSRTVEQILTQFARRWELEVAFRNAKQSLGLENPQNGWWRSRRPAKKKRAGPYAHRAKGKTAIEHTFPLAFTAYAIVVLWYLRFGNPKNDVLRVRKEQPWYRHKTTPSFNDMLAAVRRAMCIKRFSTHPLFKGRGEEIVEALPLWLLAA